MAAKDLQHCAKLLSQMLDKDTGPVSSQGGIQAKRKMALSTPHCVKPFITTGRLSRKVVASKLKKSRTSKLNGKPKAICSLKQVKTPNKDCEQDFDDGLSSLSSEYLANQGSKEKREDLKRNISRFLADQDSKSTAQKGFRIPTTDRGASSKSEGRRMSPPVPVLFNHRLTCSTPNETPKRLVDLGDTLILNGSTGTQILNATDEVQALLKPEKKGSSLKLVRATIDTVPNPNTVETSKAKTVVSAPLSSTKLVRILGRDGYLEDADMKQMFKSPDKRHVVIGVSKKSMDSPSGFPVKYVAQLENSVHSVGVGNSVHDVSVGNAACNVYAENSLRIAGAGYSMHSTDDDGESRLRVGYSVLHKPHPTERSVKYNDKLDKLDNSEFDRKHLKSSYSPSVIKRRSGSMVDLSSDRTGAILQSDSTHTSSMWKDSLSEKGKRDKKNRSLIVTNRGHDSDACGDNADVEITDHGNSDKTRLVSLLKQVKDVISEKQNCRISRLINEIQDVVSNTPTKSAVPISTDIETELALQPLRSENAQLRRRIRILNQQVREKEKLLEAVDKPDPSFQVLHLSMLNQHLEKELGDFKQEVDDLHKINQDLQKEFDKVVQEKVDILQVVAKKDDDHIKSLQEKMCEVSQAKKELEEIQKQRQVEVEQLRTQVKHLEFDLAQKDKEIDQAQSLIRGLQGSMSRLVHDLQSSRPYPMAVNSGNLNETLKSVKHLIHSNINKTHSSEESLSNSYNASREQQQNELQCSSVRETMPKPLNVEMQKNTTVNVSQTKNSLSSDSSKSQSSRIKDCGTRFEESNARRIEEWKRQTEAAWPSAGITVKELLNPEASQALYSAACASFNNFDNFKSFSDVKEDHDKTLVENCDEEKAEFSATQNGPDMSRHSITDYFRKYDSSNAFSVVPNHDRKSSFTLSQCSSPQSSTYSGSYHDQSFPESRAEDELISIHMSDFNNLSDHRHSSEIDSDLSDFEENMVKQKKETKIQNKQGLNLPATEAMANKVGLGLASLLMEETREGFGLKSLPIVEDRNSKQSLDLTSLQENEVGQRLELDLTSLQIAETESTGTTCTLSSFGTIGSVDDRTFQESLASLDANIAMIQENLRRDLVLKYPTLANSI